MYSQPVRAAYDRYYPLWAPDLSPASKTRHLYDLQRWELHSGNPPIGEITTITYQQFRLVSAEHGHLPSTTETTLRTIRQTLRACRALGVLSNIPDAGRSRRIASPRPSPPSPEEFGRMLSVCRWAPWPGPNWWRTWLVTAVWTGLRLSDLTWGLSMDHVRGDRIEYEASKTKKRHQWPLSPVLVEHWAHLPRKKGQRAILQVSKNHSRLRSGLQEIAKMAGVKRRITPQTMRQAAVTMWAVAGDDCGKVIHGVGLPRILSHYLMDFQLLQAHADAFPWPEEALITRQRQMLLF